MRRGVKNCRIFSNIFNRFYTFFSLFHTFFAIFPNFSTTFDVFKHELLSAVSLLKADARLALPQITRIAQINKSRFE
jgi:hypothetical protein